MAENEQRRTRAKVWAAEIDAARRRAGFALPEGLTSAADRFRRLVSQWALAEVAPGRLLPWLPVAFGFGIVAYFTADREPAWWAASSAALAGVIVAFVARRRAFGFAMALGLAAIAAGFATATLRTEHIAHPVLLFPVSSVTLSGFVEIREEPRQLRDQGMARRRRRCARRQGCDPA